MSASEAAPTPSGGSRRRGRIIAGAIAVGVILALVIGFVVSQSAGRPTITTATAQAQTLTVSVSAPGTIDARSRRSVYAPIAGTLASVKVSDGEAVKKGQVLATLEADSLKSAVAQAEAAVAAAKSQARAADAQLAAARAMPDTTSRLRTSRNAAITAAQAAQAAASSARDAADAALDVAQDDANALTIKAPASGNVSFPVLAITSLDGTGPKAATGAAVTTATPVFTIINLTKLNFEAQVDEADIAGVTTKATAAVTLDAFPGQSLEGTVSDIATESMTTTTGGTAYLVTIPVTAADDATLRLGMSGNAVIDTAVIEDALVVPTQAVQVDGTQKYVFTVDGDRVVRTDVTVGASTDTLTQITEGLSEGATVATTGVGSLTDGAAVHVSN